MPQLAELQQAFLGFLLGRDEAFVEHVLDQGKVSARTRAEIYRNGYRLRLRDTINTDHEILGYYLGDELFERMIDAYIDSHPSHYTSLRHFAEHLPDFLRANAPFSEHPVLAELAAFERILLFAFDAADADRIPTNALMDLAGESWPSMRFRFHPSMQLFVAHWNSVAIWQALKAEQEPPTAIAEQNRHWLIWRNTDRVTEFRPASVAEFAVLRLALAGNDFATLCERLGAWYAPEEISREALETLQSWLGHGIVQRLVTD